MPNKTQSLVPDLESCKKLAEHVELETYFGWHETPEQGYLVYERNTVDYQGREVIAAPMAGELLVALPKSYELDEDLRNEPGEHGTDPRYGEFDTEVFGIGPYIKKYYDNRPPGLYRARYGGDMGPAVDVPGDTPAQALASLTIHLLEQKFIAIDDLINDLKEEV